MFERVNKLQRVNELRIRQREINHLLAESDIEPALIQGLRAESLEISRILPDIEAYVTDVMASPEQQAKEIEEAKANEKAVAAQQIKLLKFFNKKISEERESERAAKARLEDLAKVAANERDPVKKANAEIAIQNQKILVADLASVISNINFNITNSGSIAAGKEQLKLTDLDVLADVNKKRELESKEHKERFGTVAHDMAIESLRRAELSGSESLMREIESFAG
ncbi:hypothetical protein [Vibrio atypicus]|uniref:hypothetical protein n=1 Tax=Vibrio atypicus TaxID=558271 RepID=UPI003735A7F4